MVSLKVDTARMSGNFHKTATIYSNDPINKTYKLKLTGNVETYLLVKPRRSLFLGVSPGEIQTKSILVEARGDETFKILDTSSDTLEAVIEHKVKEIIPGKKYEIQVTTREINSGRYGGYLEIFTDHPKKSLLKIRVNVDIRSEVVASPPFAHFGTIEFEN